MGKPDAYDRLAINMAIEEKVHYYYFQVEKSISIHDPHFVSRMREERWRLKDEVFSESPMKVLTSVLTAVIDSPSSMCADLERNFPETYPSQHWRRAVVHCPRSIADDVMEFMHANYGSIRMLDRMDVAPSEACVHGLTDNASAVKWVDSRDLSGHVIIPPDAKARLDQAYESEITEISERLERKKKQLNDLRKEFS